METKEFQQIAFELKSKIEEGLKKDGMEISAIPTFIVPKDLKTDRKAVIRILVLDWGGTNFRAAILEFKDGELTMLEVKEKKLSAEETIGFDQADLFREMTALIKELSNLDKVTHIGYCFSYPTKSLQNGEAELIELTKDVSIKEMEGKLVGEPLLNYLKTDYPRLKNIKVINDTVASLLAGLTKSDYDAYIGLIVGTGTNMAALMQTGKIEKLRKDEVAKIGNKIPVNLESGRFHPKHLTIYDEMVDQNSKNKGKQRFEKAVSGMYLGEIFKSVYPFVEFEEKFDAKTLTTMLSYPAIYKDEYVQTAKWIYERSAQLVAASLAGLILVLLSHDEAIKRVLLTAEGSLFWSENRKGMNYSEMVMKELHCLLCDFGYEDVSVELYGMKNANLIGTAIAALS